MISRIFSRQNILLSLVVLNLVSFNTWAQGKDANDGNSLSIAAKPVMQSGSDDILKKIPVESLFVLRVNKFDNSLSKIDQFLTGVSPVPLALRIMVRVKFAEILGNPQLAGVNMDGDFVLFALPVATPQDVLFFLLIPVTDYQQFVSENANLGKQEISEITINGAVKAFSKKFGNYALISQTSENLQKLTNVTSGLDTILDNKQIEQSASTPIWACGNMQIINKVYSSTVAAQFESAKNRMQNPSQNSSKSTSKKRTSKNGTARKSIPQKSTIQKNVSQNNTNQIAIMNIYFDSITKLMAQSKLVTININPDPEVLKITENIVALPGSELAAAFATHSSAAKNASFLGYLKNGSVFNVISNMNTPLNKKMNDFSVDAFFALSGGKISEIDKSKFEQLTIDFKNIVGDNMLCSFATDTKNKPPFAAEYMIEIKDPNKFNSLIDRGIELSKSEGLFEFYKQMGLQTDLTFKRNTDTYNGVNIVSLKFSIKAVDVNSPQTKMITQMYGQGFEYKLALIDNLYVAVMGADPNTAIRSLIDKVKSGNVKQPDSEIQNALTLIPDADKADFFGTVNLLRYFELIKSMMPVAPQGQPIEIPQSSTNIAFAAKSQAGSLTFDIALPKQHISETALTLMTIQQQMGAQRKVMMENRKQARLLKQDNPEKSMWTCSIHKKVNVDLPGLCPICKRELIPVVTDETINTPGLQNDTKPAEANGDREKRLNTRATMQKLQMSILQYKKANGQLPADLTALAGQGANGQNPDGQAAESPKDGWGNDFVYEVSSSYTRGFIIISNGSDNLPGGQGFAADISTDPIGLKRKERREKMPAN